MDVTDEMVTAFLAAWDRENRIINDSPGEYVETGARDRAGLAAVLAIVERDLRERLADELEEHAIHLRNGAFRTGAVGIEYVNGVEGAAYQVRSGDLP